MGLIVKKLQKAYPEFFMDISLEVKKGELLTLLGPSGCGKTTTLNLIAGFLNPDTGQIILNGEDITNLPPHKRKIGIVFQDYALFPHMNVYKNIAFGLKMSGIDEKRIRKRVEELLRLTKLESYEKRSVTTLSGGEQQRVALARALAPNPELLLLDEPLSALDAKLRKELRGEVRRIIKEIDLTTIYVTHDQEEAMALSDRIAVMKDGKIEQTGT
ncbi:MAG: ABC transporter ATP-binding protein, partial [Spirochaetes bacterium]